VRKDINRWINAGAKILIAQQQFAVEDDEILFRWDQVALPDSTIMLSSA
jgi:hypothetical protein